MTYVLQRHGDGLFVARPGQAHSYTKYLQHADTFPSKEAAEAGKCGNESAVSLDHAMKGGLTR